MKPINIYALTRVKQNTDLQRFERQMSARRRFLKIKKWELQGLEGLVLELQPYVNDVSELEFFYSFQIPKLGKEFDLLRVSDEWIVNVELKSEPVPDESIRRQLLQNKYYLSTLGKSLRFYTYISKTNRLVRLTNSENLVDANWNDLATDLMKQKNCFSGHIESLFREEDYIISPLVQPERFLNQEYFLTSQQKDIEKHIFKKLKQDPGSVQGFTGAPGTGKTLLLYDIAMRLSEKNKVAVFHCSSFREELHQLDQRLKRIDFFSGLSREEFPDLTGYSAILIDEAHYLSEQMAEGIMKYSREHSLPVICAYDLELIISKEEIRHNGMKTLEEMDGYEGYKLTNRIRMNAELSAFIHSIIQGNNRNHRQEYPNVRLFYANNEMEEKEFLKLLHKKEFVCITDSVTNMELPDQVSISDALSREFENVVMVMDHRFSYEQDGLHAQKYGAEEEPVRNLFHGLSRAKAKVALVVRENPDIFERLLLIVQGKGE